MYCRPVNNIIRIHLTGIAIPFSIPIAITGLIDYFKEKRVLRPRVSSGQVCLEQNNHGAFISYISATYRSIREICVSDLFSAPVQPVGDVFTCEFVN